MLYLVPKCSELRELIDYAEQFKNDIFFCPKCSLPIFMDRGKYIRCLDINCGRELSGDDDWSLKKKIKFLDKYRDKLVRIK
jgi:hypothetical protein